MSGWLILFATVGLHAEEVAFEIGGGIILVKAGINGTAPQRFILDTGATENLLTPQAAMRLGIDGKRGKRVSGTLALGSQTAASTSFLVDDPLQALSLRLDNGIDYAGILGYPYLSKSLFSIDYQEKKLTWIRGAGAEAAKPMPLDAVRVPFVLRDRLIHVTGRVNGRGPLTFLMDTGSAEILLLPRAAEGLRLKMESGNRSDGIHFARLNTIALGAATVTNVSVVVHRLQREGIGALTYDGILGYPFLSHFKTTFNYRDQMLVLEPR